MVAQNFKAGDLGQVDVGLKRIDWAPSEVPVMARLIEELAATRPLDGEVAKRKLGSMNVAIDERTPEQSVYLTSWREGT